MRALPLLGAQPARLPLTTCDVGQSPSASDSLPPEETRAPRQVLLSFPRRRRRHHRSPIGREGRRDFQVGRRLIGVGRKRNLDLRTSLSARLQPETSSSRCVYRALGAARPRRPAPTGQVLVLPCCGCGRPHCGWWSCRPVRSVSDGPVAVRRTLQQPATRGGGTFGYYTHIHHTSNSTGAAHHALSVLPPYL